MNILEVATSKIAILTVLFHVSILSPALAIERCGGTERWSVKVGTDDAAAEVNLVNVLPISIRDINALADPRSKIRKGDNDTRLDEEKFVYSVDGILRLFKYEADNDYHLVITDGSLQYTKGGKVSKGKETGTSFIAEIADPKCYAGKKGSTAKGSHWKDGLRNAREDFEKRFPSSEDEGELIEIPVRLVGVAFFDRDHGQIGRARNGFELHPVLSIEFKDGEGALSAAEDDNLLVNSGFEDGDTGWKASPEVIDTDSYPDPARGNTKATLGNLGESGSTYLYQKVRIPPKVTRASLKYRLRVRTDEPISSRKEIDTLSVQIRDASGTWLKTVSRYSNLDRSHTYRKNEIDLSAFKGRTIRVHFVSKENGSNATAFMLDDIELQVR